MDENKKKKSEEEQTKDQSKSGRGRPKKSQPSEMINESTQRLDMATKSTPATIDSIQKDLTKFYSKFYGANSGTSAYWMGTSLDLNTWNPFMQNQRLKSINTLPCELSREDLIEALKNPSHSEMGLRAESWNLSTAQYLYYKILRLASDIPMFKYYKVPELMKESEYEKKDFVAEDVFVDNWLETFDLPNTLKRCALDVKREGKVTYVLRNSVSLDNKGHKKTNYATWQKLPSNYVKLTGIGEHGYTASFNMMIFMQPGFSPRQYPDFIQKIWKDLIDNGAVLNSGPGLNKQGYAVDIDKLQNYSYDFRYDNGGIERLKGTLESIRDANKKSYAFWVPLPQDLCYTFCSDTSHAWAIPDTSGLFLGLRELSDYDVLAGLVQSTPLTALLTAEVETIPNPNAGQDQTVINPETVVGFQEKFNTSSSTNLEAFFAPFKNFKLLSLPDAPNSSEISTNATKNFIDRAGLGGILVTTDKPSVAQVKGSQLLEEAQCDFVTKQFESVLEMIINKLLGNSYIWKLNIWGGVFTFSDEIKRTKEAVVSGLTFMLPKLASAENLSVRDTRALERYIESLEIYSDLKTITQDTQAQINMDLATTTASVSASTTSTTTDENKSGAGRPEKDVDEIDSDATAASKDSGLDTAETREYSAKEFDGHCLICGKESETKICAECIDTYELEVDE